MLRYLVHQTRHHVVHRKILHRHCHHGGNHVAQWQPLLVPLNYVGHLFNILVINVLYLHLELTVQLVANDNIWASIHGSPILNWSSHCQGNCERGSPPPLITSWSGWGSLLHKFINYWQKIMYPQLTFMLNWCTKHFFLLYWTTSIHKYSGHAPRKSHPTLTTRVLILLTSTSCFI
jgi:hypothetical protein